MDPLPKENGAKEKDEIGRHGAIRVCRICGSIDYM